jgi:hypothetical protein
MKYIITIAIIIAAWSCLAFLEPDYVKVYKEPGSEFKKEPKHKLDLKKEEEKRWWEQKAEDWNIPVG